jgi:hypothetical protein
VSEGELKKRMQKQFLSNRWSQPSDLFPILDEAKKEFPSKEVFKENGCLVWDEVVQTWFKKWFGEVEQK